jgi:hypothetical protein
MPLDTIPIDRIANDTWQRLRDSGPAGVFYDFDLLRLWEQVYGWKSAVMTNRQNVIVGFERTTAIGRFYYSLPFGWYGGFLPELEATFASEVMEELRRRRFAQENIVIFTSSEQDALMERYHCTERTTHILDFPDSYERSTNTKRNIEKADRADIVISHAIQEDTSAFLDILVAHERFTGKRRKLRHRFYSELLRISGAEDSNISIMGARIEHELVGWHIYFNTPTDRFYFDGAFNELGRKALVNFKLFSHSINEAEWSGVKRINFGASPADDTGLIRFKEGWGARPYHYYEYSRSSALKRIAEKFRRRS